MKEEYRIALRDFAYKAVSVNYIILVLSTILLCFGKMDKWEWVVMAVAFVLVRTADKNTYRKSNGNGKSFKWSLKGRIEEMGSKLLSPGFSIYVANIFLLWFGYLDSVQYTFYAAAFCGVRSINKILDLKTKVSEIASGTSPTEIFQPKD